LGRATVGAAAIGLATVGIVASGFFASATASGGPVVGLSSGNDERPVTVAGETFFTANAFNVNYAGGTVLLSSTHDGTGSILADDYLAIKVTHADSTVSNYIHDFSSKCHTADTPIAAPDLEGYFKAGLNKVSLTVKDKCGGGEGNSALYLLP
jgi:hypothetical protein